MLAFAKKYKNYNDFIKDNTDKIENFTIFRCDAFDENCENVGNIEFNIYQNAKKSPIKMMPPSLDPSSTFKGRDFFLIDVKIDGQEDNIRLAYTLYDDHWQETNFRLVNIERPIDGDYVFIKRTYAKNILNNLRTSTTNYLNNVVKNTFGKNKGGGNKSKYARSKKHKKNKKSKNTRRKK